MQSHFVGGFLMALHNWLVSVYTFSRFSSVRVNFLSPLIPIDTFSNTTETLFAYL